MGEYFLWANVTKKQYLDQNCCNDFGWMRGIASWGECALTNLACRMIEGPWHGDSVVFIGDYQTLGGSKYYKRHKLVDALGDSPYWTALEEYEEVGIANVEQYGIPNSMFRYALNSTRREFVDRERLLARDCLLVDDEDGDLFDPIPMLYAPLVYYECEWNGRWCLDVVDFANDAPKDDWVDVTPLIGKYFDDKYGSNKD